MKHSVEAKESYDKNFSEDDFCFIFYDDLKTKIDFSQLLTALSTQMYS